MWLLNWCLFPHFCLISSGTPYEDTECELCQSGFYAAGKPGHATCQQYTDCEKNGLITVLKGKIWHDAICASCDNVHKGDPKKSYILNRLHYISPKYVYVCLCVSCWYYEQIIPELILMQAHRSPVFQQYGSFTFSLWFVSVYVCA